MLVTPKPVRLCFEKVGRAIYISHLDLVRTMSRALSRSALPVWYTQGFHPHLYLTFALPLSLGTAGLCETMDFRLVEEVDFDEVVARLNAALPQGIRALWAADPRMEPKQILWADYRVALRCDPTQGEEALRQFCALPEVMAEKHGKKGPRTVDIRPLFQLIDQQRDASGLCLTLRCRAGVEVNLNPTLVVTALCAVTALPVAQNEVTRIAVWNTELETFR